MKVLPKMSEKQQKNLNKVMSKTPEIPEGLHNFLKKQIKLLKEQEFQMLKEQYSKLDNMMKQYEPKGQNEPHTKMSLDKVKEFCTSLDAVLSIIKSNQKYCIDLGGSLQGWIYSEYHWVRTLLNLPKFNKFPKANQEQIKRSFKHLKELCNSQMKEDLIKQMRDFIEEWGLKKNTEWTKMLN
jgi:hypothetical protein